MGHYARQEDCGGRCRRARAGARDPGCRQRSTGYNQCGNETTQSATATGAYSHQERNCTSSYADGYSGYYPRYSGYGYYGGSLLSILGL